MIEEKKLDSSMFEWIILNYNILILKFKSNWTVYIYDSIPEWVLRQLAEAESKWRFFIKNLQATAKFRKTDFKTLEEAKASVL